MVEPHDFRLRDVVGNSVELVAAICENRPCRTGSEVTSQLIRSGRRANEENDFFYTTEGPNRFKLPLINQ